MRDSGAEIRRILSQHYDSYKHDMVDPFLAELRRIEVDAVALYVQARGSNIASADFSPVTRLLYSIRRIERDVDARVKATQRFALDGPPE